MRFAGGFAGGYSNSTLSGSVRQTTQQYFFGKPEGLKQ